MVMEERGFERDIMNCLECLFFLLFTDLMAVNFWRQPGRVLRAMSSFVPQLRVLLGRHNCYCMSWSWPG